MIKCGYKNSKGKYSHPFNDVPQWAEPYVGYMYENGLTTGISQDTYGSKEILDGKSFMTFVLRILGYDDYKGDFQWKDVLEFANEIEILTDDELSLLQSRDFNRDGLVLITYNALNAKFKDSDDTILGSQVGIDINTIDKIQKETYRLTIGYITILRYQI